jgi:hypothetical protein
VTVGAAIHRLRAIPDAPAVCGEEPGPAPILIARRVPRRISVPSTVRLQFLRVETGALIEPNSMLDVR